MIFLCCCMKWCSSKLLDQVGSRGWEAMLAAWLSAPGRLKELIEKKILSLSLSPWPPPTMKYNCYFLRRILKVSLSLCNVDFTETMPDTNPGICCCSSSQVGRATGRLYTHNASPCSCIKKTKHILLSKIFRVENFQISQVRARPWIFLSSKFVLITLEAWP